MCFPEGIGSYHLGSQSFCPFPFPLTSSLLDLDIKRIVGPHPGRLHPVGKGWVGIDYSRILDLGRGRTLWGPLSFWPSSV